MEPTQLVSKRSPSGDREQRQSNECEELIAFLPKIIIPSWGPNGTFYLYQGFWIPAIVIRGIISCQKHFKARHTDIVVATCPKSGTTWLESLTFAIVNRNKYDPLSTTHPLLTSNPHDLVRSLEFYYYSNGDSPDLQHLPDPRILETHAPFPLLPPSIMNSSCRIIYICRNPFDQFTSYWKFLGNVYPDSMGTVPLEEGFEMFCKGIVGFGPILEHMLGYWNESLKKPDKILFFKYEDMKSDVISHCKKLAEFVGFPFAEEEEKQGVVEGIAKLCSFENLKNLEVNKTGLLGSLVPNSTFFRKGEVGDSANYFTPSMTERMDKILKDKFAGSLSFPVPCRVKGEVKD